MLDMSPAACERRRLRQRLRERAMDLLLAGDSADDVIKALHWEMRADTMEVHDAVHQVLKSLRGIRMQEQVSFRIRTIELCSCGTRYIKTRPQQKVCIRCLFSKSKQSAK